MTGDFFNERAFGESKQGRLPFEWHEGSQTTKMFRDTEITIHEDGSVSLHDTWNYENIQTLERFSCTKKLELAKIEANGWKYIIHWCQETDEFFLDSKFRKGNVFCETVSKTDVLDLLLEFQGKSDEVESLFLINHLGIKLSSELSEWVDKAAANEEKSKTDWIIATIDRAAQAIRRDGPDFWPTPACLIRALVDHVIPTLPAAPIWECAAGDGRLGRAIAATGRQVIATDLFPQDGSEPHDFLSDEPLEAARGAIAVTNPPFNKTDEFLTRGLDLFDRGLIAGIVLLMRHDHLMSERRVDALSRAVREVHCNWSRNWIPNSRRNLRWSFRWLIWHGGQRQPPLYLRLEPDEIEERAMEQASLWPAAPE